MSDPKEVIHRHRPQLSIRVKQHFVSQRNIVEVQRQDFSIYRRLARWQRKSQNLVKELGWLYVRIMTFKWEVAENLGSKRCCHPKGVKHSKIEGCKTAGPARYPRPMAVSGDACDALRATRACVKRVEDVHAAIHQLLDRKDWGVNGEASGLIDNGTWNYDDVVPRKELLERKTALNIGRLMTILSSAGRPRP